MNIRGLREFRSGLRGVDKDLPKALQRANKKFAQSVTPRVQAAYLRYFDRRSGAAFGSIRALGTQTQAQIAIGRERVPYLIGQEFGSIRYRQFSPWTGPGPGGHGSAGRFLYPTVREEVPELVDEYYDLLAHELRDAFPEGIVL
jgi:hypothetical protein